MQSVFKYLKERYIQTRLHVPDDGTEDIWQLLYPEHFVNMLLIKHHKRRGEKEISDVAGIMREGLMKFIDGSSHTQVHEKLSQLQDGKLYYNKFETFQLSDIFNPIYCDSGATIDPKMILINGAPGKGKTTLCKEMAYRWAKGSLLNDTTLVFLLFLRDPAIQRIYDLNDLVHYFYNFKQSAADLSAQCADVLFKIDNIDITIILDGLDEFSSTKDNLLISNILKHEVLTRCTVVVTSHPIATEILQKRADVTVEVLGFTEESKKSYIEQELQDYPNKSQRLLSFLHDNHTINSACYIPIMLTILVYTFKDYEELPKDETELYEKFICLTISRFLQKLGGGSANTALSIKHLSEMHHQYLIHLSQLAFEALKHQKHIFTKESFSANFILAFNNFHGLGLLNYTQYTSYKHKIDKCISYNFVHLSIQEYLAAYYINMLDISDQFKLLKNTFFVNNFMHI